MEDSLGDRMKGYELQLPRMAFTVIRVDGRAFHTWTKGLNRPHDLRLVDAMSATMLRLCEEISGVVCAYVQSDEISIVTQAFARQDTEAWFGGQVQKVASVSASAATAFFANAWGSEVEQPIAMFDSRVFSLPSRIEVANYLLWRQRDARRNAISMLAEHYLSSKRVHGVSVPERIVMLLEEGVDVSLENQRFINGQLAIREQTTGPVRYIDKRTGEWRETDSVTRWTWRSIAAPDLDTKIGGWCEMNLPVTPISGPITNATRC